MGIGREILKELSGVTTEHALSEMVAIFNLPAGLSLKLVQAVVKSGAQHIMGNCYDDIASRSLSMKEVDKHDRVFKIAENIYWELAEKDNVHSMVIYFDESYIQYAFEVAEHVSLEAMRQSESAKIQVLGQFYGRAFYYCDLDWQDMHQIINLCSDMSFRQLVLIKLICEGFNGNDPELFITNTSACVETNRLLDYGIWFIEGATFATNNSAKIQLQLLVPTDYAKLLYKVLMLERISDEDVKRTIDSLKLSEFGERLELISKEEVKSHSEWEEL